VPGEDYPIFAEVPQTAFSCDGQVDGGFYADSETKCQAFHICATNGHGGLVKYSFLCPNGTIFNQNYFICDWWFNFDCTQAVSLYAKNFEIAAERDAAASDLTSYGAPLSYGAPPSYGASLPSPPPTASEFTPAAPSASNSIIPARGVGLAAPQVGNSVQAPTNNRRVDNRNVRKGKRKQG
jgi:Chitin binding Peritrophin-A domain